MHSLSIEYDGSIFSPFSGKAIDSEGFDGSDATLLLVYYGDAGQIAYVGSSLKDQVDEDSDEDISEIIQKLKVPNGIAFSVDTGWNGVNFYVFAPAR